MWCQWHQERCVMRSSFSRLGDITFDSKNHCFSSWARLISAHAFAQAMWKASPQACWFARKSKFRKGLQLVNVPCYAQRRPGGLAIPTSLEDLPAWEHSVCQRGGSRYKGPIWLMTPFCSWQIPSALFGFDGPSGRGQDDVQGYFAFKWALYSRRFTSVVSLNKVPFEVH